MIKRVDMTVDKCLMCKTTEVYLYAGQDAYGDVFKNDVCIDCEEKAEALMTQPERLQTLCRWTFEDRR